MLDLRPRNLALTTCLLAVAAAACACSPAAPEGPTTPAPKAVTPPPPPVSAPPPPPAAAAPAGFAVSVELNVNDLYPAGWLPPPYAPDYPVFQNTVKHFTEQSLMRDGISGATVTVRAISEVITVVAITGSDPAINNYGKMLAAFFDSQHAAQALAGVNNCKATAGCWCTDPGGCYKYSKDSPQPWAMFLPLGLPLVNQKAVLFLDYPPSSSLTYQNPDGSYGDYLYNWTMCRWHNLMTNAGATNATLFETIVDSRPVAAAGTGLTTPLPDATKYFNSPGNSYLTPMIDLLASPPGRGSATHNLPVTALGSMPRVTLGKMVNGGAEVGVLQVGNNKLSASSAKSTPWVGNNHPDVTTYQCCPGDASCGADKPTNQCLKIGNNNNHDLLACEVVDFTVACFLQAMAENPDSDVNTVKSTCASLWSYPQSAPVRAHAFCIQAKLDNNNKAAQCATYAAADAYCTANGNNPCASLTCDPSGAKPAAKPAAAAAKPGAPAAAAARSSGPPLTCTQMPQQPQATK